MNTRTCEAQVPTTLYIIVDIFWPMDFILCVHRYIYKILPIVDTFP